MNIRAALVPLLIAAAAAAPVAAARTSHPVTITASEGGDDHFEVILRGTNFTSRDAPESRLLEEAARFTVGRDRTWFRLLHLPGERPGEHPARPDAAFGTAYGHWQPHWSYYRSADGWQPWHPEWGARFWASDVDPGTVERFEVHAMIELGRGAPPANAHAVFDARAVIADFAARPNARP